ncbi:hypothetical protein BGZ73_005454, partial [Actinomortierella ambigua]
AIVRLGQAYTDGRGVEKNDLEAASWFFKAAARDSPMAQFCLGQMYDEGRGVVQCDREAARRSERKKKASVAKPRRDQAEGTTKARGIRRSHSDVPRLFHKTAWRHDPEASNLFMRAMMEAEERFEQGPMGSFAAWKSHQPLK